MSDQRLTDWEEEERLVRAWGKFLRGFHWDFYATLTFRFQRKAQGAMREFKRWIRRLEQRGKNSVEWFCVIEEAPRGYAHIHTLLGGNPRLRTSDLEGAWSTGVTHVERYEPGEGACDYLMKGCGREEISYEASPALERIRVGSSDASPIEPAA